jgi:GTP 3',8-cyclase
MSGLQDGFHRTIDYLRISVTDKCNLRCICCMPAGGIVPMEHKEILRYEEIQRLLILSVRVKPSGHHIKVRETDLETLVTFKKGYRRPMSKIGG